MDEISSLLGQVSLGDREAFSRLYQQTSPKLYSILLRILRNRPEAEDALQEVFVKIWQRADRFRPNEGRGGVWLAAIARNQAIDLMRARKPTSSAIDEAYDLASPNPGPEEAAVNQSEGGRIERCMKALESDKAEAVKRAYVEGLSYQELAEFYNIPINTMRTWLRRSLLKLRECLGQ
ncbi:sigma-70 family RNA polymerase sigma factor [Rhizobium sp. KVB221]|uniref:Sigma-70 family RNA polymerase sigma factor n=1 Tax=Rhizobium setariae TaxID=2801340 RepID=A0A937CPF6_9HYPH|nr:sigma-70 family RNA polymerase sigma factor [Rhizobium setariae]MBL0371752.1 sigma-70 family RNA polymerase sigma factor [Rhizobium setariae]